MAALPTGFLPFVVQQDDREFDRNAPTVLGQSRHRQEVALAVVTFAGRHYPIVSRPMTFLRLSGMIKSRELPTASSEVKPNIRVAPGFQKLIQPVGVGGNDCVRSGAEDCLDKTVRYARCSVGRLEPAIACPLQNQNLQDASRSPTKD